MLHYIITTNRVTISVIDIIVNHEPTYSFMSIVIIVLAFLRYK